MIQRIVIIGAGQAGASAAFKLRALGYEGELTLVGEEDTLPYQRPPLSKKYLTGAVEAARLHLKPEAVYRDKAIALQLGCRVTAIDAKTSRVTLDDTQALEYDRLILATGATPNELPASLGGGLDNVYSFRTLAHAAALQSDFCAGRKLLVVGGGYIGLEIAAVAVQCNLNVEIVEKAPRILQRVASQETADHFRALHQSHGVVIHENAGLASIRSNKNRITGVTLDNGHEIEADVLVAGIGIRPNSALAEMAGLTVDDGIVVDAFGQTSDPAIFAAGDCTRFPYGERVIRLESVQNAIEQAEHVAGHILGDDRPYQPVPWFWSDQYQTKLQIAGLNHGFDHVIRRPGARTGESIWYYRDTEFLAVDAIDDPKAFMLGKQWLKQGVQPDRTRLDDPAVDLKTLAIR
ncbi:NAD(P)/FAD-dependent oxidoreductase [Salinisphaera aquimarina]|uniref:NAD(P)/FAD-dependent oxidoreductase n=1 Tax=Salinisphaera aquimarina TaxID=2094031 RepID=A0ABV7EJS6_9GAMM